MTYDLEGTNLPPGANHAGIYCLWPDGEIFVTGTEGHFQVDGLKPGVRSTIQMEVPSRPGFRLNPGSAFQNPSVRPGEVRDLGEVRVQMEPNP
jgi:hypothetical protein